MKHINPIVLDFETSGLDLNTSGIWQIGAIDLNNPDEFFLEEGRIDEDDLIDNNALEVVGKTEEELRDKNKQSQKQLFERFLNWMKGRPVRNFLCQGPQWDVSWLIIRTKKYGLNKTFHHRSFDLHSIAQMKYKNVIGEFLIDDDHSDMNLSKIIEFCGLKEERKIMIKEKVVQEGKPHNALEDCKLEGECFFRLVYGENIFPEFKEFEVPEVLRKQ